MVYTVYILYSQKDRRLYVGCTSNLNDRLQKHRYGGVEATRHRRPLVLIHNEEHKDKTEAFKRERFLKSLWGAREKMQILRKFFG